MTERKKRMAVYCVLGALVLLIFTVIYQKQGKKQEPLSVTAFKLNTVVKIDLYDTKD